MANVYRQCLECKESNWVPEQLALENKCACPACGKSNWKLRVVDRPRSAQALVKDSGWESENGGRGRLCNQLGNKKQARAYCRSRQDFREKAARRGLKVEDA
jgi:hypothetical protein